MPSLESYYIFFLGLQFAHSIEELTMGFHAKFPGLKMTFRFFLAFEICFFMFWLLILAFRGFPFREYLMAFFIALMFANGVWHIVWFWFFEKAKKYVPGLITAFPIVFVFLVYFFKLIF